MKKVLIGLGVLVVLVIAAALIVPAFIPVEVYKREIVAGIEQATGRKARIDGDFKLSVLPRAEFVAGKVSLGNAKGGKAENMMTLDRLTVKVGIFPLLGGNLEVDALVAEKPVINLEVDRQGRGNWDFGTGAKPGAAKPEAGAAAGGPGLGGLKLGDVRLVDGRISYLDMKTGAAHSVDDINLKVALPSLSSPMRAEGSVVWNKEQLTLTAVLSDPNAALAGRSTGVDISLKSAPVGLSFKGKASTGPAVAVAGRIDLAVPSVRKLAAWAGSPLNAPGTGLGPLKISGDLDMKGKVTAFRNAKLSLDAIAGEGSLAFDQRGRKPLITAALKLGELDLNPYLPPEQAAPAKSGTAQQGPGDWSDDPIDLKALDAMNAALDLTVAGIVMRKIKIGESVLKVTLNNGTLVTDLSKMALYGGVGKAKVTTRGGSAVPSVTLTSTLTKFQANPFMRDAMNFDRIEGAADADVSINTQGRSQRQMIEALAGNGKVTFRDGAIKGVNLGAMVRNVKSAFLDSSARETQKTDFSEMGGTFVIRRGILTNNDLLLKSPLLRLTGKGTVDLPKRTIDYRVEPKLVATATGQGGAASATGISVPVNVKGPWHDISYTPDLGAALGGIAKQPEKALEGVKGLIPGMGGGSSGSGTTTQPTEKPSSSPIEEGLKGLFGR
ncbi:MAG: AsmA family protein [Alphaproteobacteria bacterium]|nr:AsmA family protein [Alphaproteobacteria bacterium]